MINFFNFQIFIIILLFVEKCEIALAKAAKPDNNDQILAVRSKIKKLVDHINNVKDELYKNKDAASISEKYWRNVSIC